MLLEGLYRWITSFILATAENSLDILDLSRFLLVDSWAVSNFGILHNFGKIQSVSLQKHVICI